MTSSSPDSANSPDESRALLDEWSRARYHQLLGTARRLLRPPLSHKHEPEDLVQEALYHAVKSQFSIIGRQEPEILSYLLKSMKFVRQRWSRYHRQQKRSVSRECSLERLQANKSGSIACDGVPISDQTSPSGRAIRNEQSAALYSALSQLPPQLRRGRTDAAARELSVGEIAGPLGCRALGGSRLLYVGTDELIDRIRTVGRGGGNRMVSTTTIRLRTPSAATGRLGAFHGGLRRW